MNGTQVITQFTHGLVGFAIPLAILGVVFIGLMLIATPFAKNLSAEARSSLIWVLVGVVVVTFASGIVALTSLMGNGS